MALTESLAEFYLTTGLSKTRALDDAVTAAFTGGGTHEGAHMRKHLDALALDTTGEEKAAVERWAAYIDAHPNDRITDTLK